MSDTEKPTKSISEPSKIEEEDIINLIFPDGTNEEIPMPAGTIDSMEKIAKEKNITVEEVFHEAIKAMVEKYAIEDSSDKTE